MNDVKQNQGHEAENEAHKAASEHENSEQHAESSVAATEDALEDAQTEIGKLKDQILRAMAETENTRRRMKKEAEDACTR